MKDLIIGAASNYEFDKLRLWVSSARLCGFEGDIIIVATNINKKTIDQLSKRGVKVYLYGDKQPDGSYIKTSKTLSYVERFLYLQAALSELNLSDYRYIISTDTRDVLFQRNPSEWLENNLSSHKLVASSECINFEDEPFNSKNAQEALGPLYFKYIANKEVYNVGVLAGQAKEMKALIDLIWQLSSNSPIRVVDQAVFNMIVHSQLMSGFQTTRNNSDWAIQLGASEEAVKAGIGECGQKYGVSNHTLETYRKIYLDDQPKIEGNLVKTASGENYYIVHQYDRIPSLNSAINAFYEANERNIKYPSAIEPTIMSPESGAFITVCAAWSEQIIEAQQKALSMDKVSLGTKALKDIIGTNIIARILLPIAEFSCLIARKTKNENLGIKGTNLYNMAKELEQLDTQSSLKRIV